MNFIVFCIANTLRVKLYDLALNYYIYKLQKQGDELNKSPQLLIQEWPTVWVTVVHIPIMVFTVVETQYVCG